MRISQEEIRGLVVVALQRRGGCVRKANGTRYSLAAGVWSRDIGRVPLRRRVKRGSTPTLHDARLPGGRDRLRRERRRRRDREFQNLPKVMN